MLGFGFVTGLGDAFGEGFGEGRVDGEEDGDPDVDADGVEDDCDVGDTCGLDDTATTGARVSADLGDPKADATDPMTTAPTSSAPKMPPPTNSPFVHGDRAVTLGDVWLGTQLAPFHLDLPSDETLDSQLVPFQYHLPSGET